MQNAFRGPCGGDSQSGRDKNPSLALYSSRREPRARAAQINRTSGVELDQHQG